MAVFNEPSKWQTSLVNSGDANTIPQNTPAGTGEASFEDGFPQITQVPIGAGGIAPDRKDFNGLFKVLGDWIFFAQNGGLPTYSADFDYVVGRYVVYNNTLYKCIQANGASSTVVAPDSVSPLGSDYWKDIENQDSTSLIPNQTIVSELPLTDANLHLKDGALLSGSGAYSDYVDLIAEIYNSGDATTSFCTEAEWQTSNTNYGFCNKFVYDSVANTVRLPKINSEHGALIKTYSSGASWYRIYQDGWCEQGGVVTDNLPNNATYTVNLYVDYINTTYSISVTLNRNIPGAGVGIPTIADDPTTSSFIFMNDGDYDEKGFRWFTCGYIDISDLQTAPIYEYIVVGTVSKTQIQIDIDNVMADLALKADKDFTNIDNTAKIAIAHNAMPSNKYDDLTVGASGTTYTAPADGYVTIQNTANATVNLINQTAGSLSSGFSVNGTNGAFIPVSKGDIFILTYTALSTYIFRFIYAVGSESEQ